MGLLLTSRQPLTLERLGEHEGFFCPVPDFPSGSDFLQGVIQAQLGHVQESCQGLSIGSRRQRGDRLCVLVGPAIFDRHDGVHSQDCSRIEGGRTSGCWRCCLSPLTWSLHSSNTWQWNKSFPVSPITWRFTRMHSTSPSHQLPTGLEIGKPPAAYQILHKMTLDTEEQNSLEDLRFTPHYLIPQWLQLLRNCHPRTSVQSFWEGNWPSSRKRKWQQFLQNLRLLLTSNCYGGTRCFRILVSNFKFWTQCGLLLWGVPRSGPRAQISPTVGSDHLAGGSYGQVICDLHPEDQGLSTVQHEEDCYSQEDPASQSFGFRALGFSEGSYHSEDDHPGSVLLCRCWQGSPSASRSSPAQEGQGSCFSFLSPSPLMGCR